MNLTVKQQLRRNPVNGGYATPVKTYSVPASENDDKTITVVAQAVYPIDPNVEPIPIRMPCIIQDGTTPANIAVVGPAYQDITGSAVNSITVRAIQYVSQPLTFLQSPLRTPTIFRHALCTTVAATAVWDPAAGRSFRIMGYVITPSAGMAAAGIQLITLLDAAAAITIAHQVYLPAAANVVNQPSIVVQLPGNGYLSTAADNILNCTLTSACTAGAISIMVYGTEE